MSLLSDAASAFLDTLDRLRGPSPDIDFKPGDDVTFNNHPMKVEAVGHAKVHCVWSDKGQSIHRSFLPGQLRKGTIGAQFLAAMTPPESPNARFWRKFTGG